MVVANLFAVTAVGLTFDRLFRVYLKKPPRIGRTVALAGLTGCMALAVVEQINLVQAASLSRSFERAHFRALPPAPSACRTFYAAPQANRPPFEVQIDAMIVARAQHVSTINGYSGLFPPGWDFYDTSRPDYEQRAVAWAVKRGITNGLCRLDVDYKAWSVVDVDKAASLRD